MKMNALTTTKKSTSVPPWLIALRARIAKDPNQKHVNQNTTMYGRGPKQAPKDLRNL
jgi:hypothetical protein